MKRFCSRTRALWLLMATLLACSGWLRAAAAQGIPVSTGNNGFGQLGDETNTSRHRVAGTRNLNGVTAVAAGWGHSLALKSDGTVWAWGHNGNSELGDGTNTSSNVPVQVSGLTNITAIAAGGFHSLALRSTGAVVAWGHNHYGQLGNNSTNSSNVPVAVPPLPSASGVTAIAAGSYHSLAIRNGAAKAWGWNIYGQLGNSSYDNSLVPVQVSGLTSRPRH